jgi:hypothetical protein
LIINRKMVLGGMFSVTLSVSSGLRSGLPVLSHGMLLSWCSDFPLLHLLGAAAIACQRAQFNFPGDILQARKRSACAQRALRIADSR